MKKNNRYEMTAVGTRIEQGMTRDWMCLGARIDYWTGSPWRALADAFRP